MSTVTGPVIPEAETTEPGQRQAETKPLPEQGALAFIREHYQFFGTVSLCYGLFYAFCLYQNYFGITFPLLSAGTSAVLVLCMRKLDHKPDRMFWMYHALAFIISISSVLTANGFIQLCNIMLILVLMQLSVFHIFHGDMNWKGREFVQAFLHQAGQMLFHLPVPFRHLQAYLKQSQKKETKYLVSVGIGILISIPLLGIILSLLTSADQVFYRIIKYILIDLLQPYRIISILFMILLAYTCFYTFVGSATIEIREDRLKRILKSFDALIAITFTSVLTVVYIVFSGIQMVYLFAGGIGNLPAEFTYAEYARRGFFELLFVSLINLAIVMICNTRFRRHKVLKVLLLTISLCTYVLLASSVYRMILYIQSYHLTFLRVFVLWFLAVLFFLLSGLIVSLLRSTFSYFRYAVLAISGCYIVFAFMRPDYLIADYNVSQSEIMMAEDIHYLMNLSVDAAPAISRIETVWVSEGQLEIEDTYMAAYMDYYFENIDEQTSDLNLRTYNYAKSRAARAARGYLKIAGK